MIPESPFYLEGPGGLYEYVEQQLKENRHVLIVLAEGAGQEYVAQSMQAFQEKDASGNRLLLDVGLWLTQHIKVYSESLPAYLRLGVPLNLDVCLYTPSVPFYVAWFDRARSLRNSERLVDVYQIVLY